MPDMPIGLNSPPPSPLVAATSFTFSGDGQAARICRIIVPCAVTGALVWFAKIPAAYGLLALVAVGAPSALSSVASLVGWLKPK